MRHQLKLEKTTIRLTEADRKILQRLNELTGLKQSQVIRAALRALLRRVERPPEK
jgi:ribbon-helix-helix CopG family protein